MDTAQNNVQTVGYMKEVPNAQHTCPHCGRCPHCGQPSPWWLQPYWSQPQPYWTSPNLPNSGVATCGSGLAGASGITVQYTSGQQFDTSRTVAIN
jgi:hypothetical protein